VVGAGVGIVSIKVFRVGLFIMGMLFGAFIGTLVYMSVAAPFIKYNWV